MALSVKESPGSEGLCPLSTWTGRLAAPRGPREDRSLLLWCIWLCAWSHDSLCLAGATARHRAACQALWSDQCV